MSAIIRLLEKKMEETKTGAPYTQIETLIMCNRKKLPDMAEQAAAELEAKDAEITAWKKAYFALEFDKVTGECLLGCGGASIGGHSDDCAWFENYPQPEKYLDDQASIE